MSRRSRRYKLTLGGLATVAVTAVLLWGASWYALPEEPHIPLHEAPKGPEAGYEPGGASCHPKRLDALPPNEASTERDRCAQAREEHRVQQDELAQAVRANNLAERNLRLAYEQARIAFVQTWATIAAFVAAALAALFALFAAQHTKRSADADNLALRATRRAAKEAREDAIAQAERFQQELKIAKDNLELTRRATAETDRAWLSVSVTPISGLRIDEETISIDAHVVVENVGKGPAIGVGELGDLTFDLYQLDKTIRGSPGLQMLAGRFGETMFPNGKIANDRRFEVSRQELVDAIAKDRASEEPVGVFPTLATGVRYCLPGDDKPRQTFIYLLLQRATGAELTFNDGETEIALDDLKWSFDPITGPVT